MFIKEFFGKTNIKSKKEDNILVFLFVLLIITIILIFSKIRIEAENFKISIPKVENKIINDTFICKIKLIILGIIPIINLKIDREKVEKVKKSTRFNNMNLKIDNLGKKITKDSIKDAKQLHLRNK